MTRDSKTNIIGQHSIYEPGYLDFGDSSRTTGIMATFGSPIDQEAIDWHWTSKGFVRFPFQAPHDDPKNFSRDQLLCLVSGLYYSDQSQLVRREFWSRRYWFGFCPNGDFLGPEFYLHLILCGRIYGLYWLFPILIWFQLIHILWATKLNPKHEQNQTICVCKRSGLLWLWAFMHPDWRQSIRNYWGNWRDLNEVGNFLIEKIQPEIEQRD